MRYLALLFLISFLSSCIVHDNHPNAWYVRHYKENVKKRESKQHHKTNTWFKEHKVKRK